MALRLGPGVFGGFQWVEEGIGIQAAAALGQGGPDFDLALEIEIPVVALVRTSWGEIVLYRCLWGKVCRKYVPIKRMTKVFRYFVFFCI